MQDDNDDLMSTGFPVPDDDLDEILAALTDESVSNGRLPVEERAEPTKRKGVRMGKVTPRNARSQGSGAVSSSNADNRFNSGDRAGAVDMRHESLPPMPDAPMSSLDDYVSPDDDYIPPPPPADFYDDADSGMPMWAETQQAPRSAPNQRGQSAHAFNHQGMMMDPIQATIQEIEYEKQRGAMQPQSMPPQAMPPMPLRDGHMPMQDMRGMPPYEKQPQPMRGLQGIMTPPWEEEPRGQGEAIPFGGMPPQHGSAPAPFVAPSFVIDDPVESARQFRHQARPAAPIVQPMQAEHPVAPPMPSVGGVEPSRATVPQATAAAGAGAPAGAPAAGAGAVATTEDTMDAQIVRAMAGPQAKALSVSKFVVLTDNFLSNLGDVVVSGELSQISIRNHMYFALKDEESKVDCLMFSKNVRALNFQPQEGQKVFVQGKSSLYKVTGVFKLIVTKMSLAGHGMIMEQLRQLEQKLAREGVFNNCRRLPRLIERVAIVTSVDGRVIDDIATNAHRRNPLVDLIFLDTKVQGQDAVPQILRALEYAYVNARAWNLDVIIIGRGGGSFEDLLCFSDERVVRMVAQSPVPIISAVGHDEDCPLCDHAADLRVSTPTAAAETITPITRDNCLGYLEDTIGRAENAIFRQLDYLSERFEFLFSRLSNAPVAVVLGRRRSYLYELMSRLDHCMDQRINERQQRIAMLREKLDQVAGVERTHELRIRIDEAISRLNSLIGRKLYEAQTCVFKATNAFERNLAKVEHKLNEYSYYLDANILPRADKVISDLVSSRKEQQMLFELMSRLDRAVEQRLKDSQHRLAMYKEKIEQVSALDRTHDLRLRIDDAINRLDIVGRRIHEAQFSVVNATNALDRHIARLDQKRNEYSYLLDANILPRIDKVITKTVDSRMERLQRVEHFLTAFYDHEVNTSLSAYGERLLKLISKLESLDPLYQLKLGLSVTTKDGMHSVKGEDLSVGDTIITLMQGYKVTSTVSDIKEHEYHSSPAIAEDELNAADVD